MFSNAWLVVINGRLSLTSDGCFCMVFESCWFMAAGYPVVRSGTAGVSRSRGSDTLALCLARCSACGWAIALCDEGCWDDGTWDQHWDQCFQSQQFPELWLPQQVDLRMAVRWSLRAQRRTDRRVQEKHGGCGSILLTAVGRWRSQQLDYYFLLMGCEQPGVPTALDPQSNMAVVRICIQDFIWIDLCLV